MFKKYFFDIFHPTIIGGIIMLEINFKKTKEYIYKSCVNRVDKKRKELKKPQIDLCRNDKSLVSCFFNCKITKNNPYLVTKKLLDYYSDETAERTGAVPAFKFSNEHEVLWGNDEEFDKNLFSIFSLIIKDILDSSCKEKEILEYTLSDNIIYAKYLTFYKIKKVYDISLLKSFAIWDYMVDDIHMNNYLETAINHLYNKPDFMEKFKKIFLVFSKRYNDYTHIDKRLYKHFIPEFKLLLEEYKPTNSSLGIRVKTLIETDIIKSIEQINTFKNNSEFLFSSEFQINKEIINASSLYITKLEKIADTCEQTGIYIYGW